MAQDGSNVLGTAPNDNSLIWWRPDGVVRLTDTAGDVLAFQLCYDRLNHERVLAWSEFAGFIHRRIDDGEGRPAAQKMAPIMVADGWFAADDVAAEFDSRSTSIDGRWRKFIRMKIGEAAALLPTPRNPS